MSLKAFKKLYLSITNSPPKSIEAVGEYLKDIVKAVNTLQNNTETSFAPLNANIANDGLILKNINIAGGFLQLNIINHTLNRPLTGWVIIRERAGALAIWDNQDKNPNPNQTLWLLSTDNTNIDLYVF